MKHLISLNGDKNQVAFVRGNDGDINISFDIPSKQIMWESVRVGVGNSGGQTVPYYVKDALIQVCEAMKKWEDSEKDIVSEGIEEIDEEGLDELAMIKYPCNCSPNETYCDCCIIPDLKEAFKAGYRKALNK